MQYRIIRKNSYFGWTYKIQRKIFGIIWVSLFIDQDFNRFSLEAAQARIATHKIRELEYLDRKKQGSKVIYNG